MDMEQMVALAVTALLLLAIFPLLWWRQRNRRISPEQPQTLERETQPLIPQRERTGRRPTASRMRRRATTASSSVASSSASAAVVQDAYAEDDEDAYEDDYPTGKNLTKKERKREEREAQREAEEAARASKEGKRDYYDEMRRRKDAEREAEEHQLEEEALARKAKEEEAAMLEFEKWKGEISVDAEGTTENELQDGNQGMLADFIEYIKVQKCVPLDELAAEFKMRTQDCINRITSLESTGRLSGVMDDRGKYIYISPEEMKAVADHIKHQGRVSISHLASRSNQFIDLEKKQLVDENIIAEGIAAT